MKIRARQAWLVDGHNVIFNVPHLDRLQDQDRRAARDQLTNLCTTFAHRYQVRVTLVFDGAGGILLPGSIKKQSSIEVVYADPEEQADGRIVFRAEKLVKAKESLVVVTNDRGLIDNLPKGAEVVSTEAFWKMLHEDRRRDADAKPRVSDPDIRAHFMALESETLDKLSSKKTKKLADDWSSRYRRELAEGEPSENRVKPPSPEPKAPSTTESEPKRNVKPNPPPRDPKEELRLKKERGRQKHLKRLQARGKKRR